MAPSSRNAVDAYNSIAELGLQRGRDKRRKQQEVSLIRVRL
jgi:hypothetical protein